MQETTIRFSKKTIRIYLIGMGAALVFCNAMPYFQGGMVAMLIPINVLSILGFLACCPNALKQPWIIMTSDTLAIAAGKGYYVFSWDQVLAYYTTKKNKTHFLAVATTEKTVELKLRGLEKSPQEIMDLFSVYKQHFAILNKSNPENFNN